MKRLLSKTLSVFLCAGFFLFACFGCNYGGGTFEESLYTSMRDMVDGVKVVYQTGYDDRNETPITNQERAKYYVDVENQIDAYAQLLLTELVGEYGRGVEAGTTIDLGATSSYGPFAFSAGIASNDVTVATLFDSNYGAIDNPIVGAQTSGATFAPITSSTYAWRLNAFGFIYNSFAPETEAEQYYSYYMDLYKDYLVIRLLEVVTDSENSVYYNDGVKTGVYNMTGSEINELIQALIAKVGYLGFTADDLVEIEDVLLSEFVGENAIDFDVLRPKDYTEPFVDTDASGGYTPGDSFLDLNGNSIRDANFTENVSSPLYLRDYATKINAIITTCVSLQTTDSKPVFPFAHNLEIRDFEPSEFFQGPKYSTQFARERFVMESAVYRSAVPMFKENTNVGWFGLFFDPDASMELNISMRLIRCTLSHTHTAGTCVSTVAEEIFLGLLELGTVMDPLDSDTNGFEIDFSSEKIDDISFINNLGYIAGMKFPKFVNSSPAPARGYHVTTSTYAVAAKYVSMPSISLTGTSFVYQDFGTTYVEFVFDPVEEASDSNGYNKFRFQFWMLPAELE